MREICFRAWNATEKCWVYENIQDICEAIYFGDTSSLSLNCSVMNDVQLKHYCLDTGLKDKNGKAIFDGDLIQWKYERLLEVQWGSVGWVLFGTIFKRWGKTCSEANTQGYTKESEILGNKIENPELLKEVRNED